ncbi:MAG: amidase family protein [Micrococcaceae bacterium]|nr:amidase family protein [Micrococcaceae bacterium]
MKSEIHWMEAGEMSRLARDGELSALEIAEAMIDRVESVNPGINAIVYWDPEQMLVEAAALDQQQARGEDLGPLHGVPYTIKDLTPMKGVPVTSGIAALKDNIGTFDAPIVERMRSAGGLFMGRTNTPESGYCPKTSNHLFGTTRNPWNRDLTAGGSSGGAGAAVAAGLGPLAEGSDGGGSIRVPAALNGVVGLKPSMGRIPKVSGVQRFASHSFHGPITRSVSDAALMLDVVAGPDARDPLSLPNHGFSFFESLDEDLTGWKIAYSETLGIDTEVDPEVSAIVRAAVSKFAGAGADVVEATPDWGDGGKAMWEGLWVPGVAALGERFDVEAMRGELDDELIELVLTAKTLRGDDITRADLFRGRYYDAFERFMRDFRILASPTTSVAAFPVERFNPKFLDGRSLADRLLRWSLTWPFNMTTTPAISIPCGFTADGRPVGLQLASRLHADLDVLNAAYAFEHLQPWSSSHPGISG